MTRVPRLSGPVVRGILEVLVWWALAFGIWLDSLSAVSGQELVVAALCALPCGLAATGARRAAGTAWTLRPAWLVPLVVLPLVVVSDLLQVLVAPLRGKAGRGRFETVPTGAAGSGTDASSRRAVATAILSLTPGSYAVDVEPDTGEMTVHALAQRGPRLERWISG